MKFVDTKRFSPVIFEGDLPKEGDLFHFRATDVPTLKKDRIQFLKDNNVFIDKEWWYKQITRCIYGYDVPNAIEEGGDAIVDGIDAFWDKDTGDCFLSDYDLLIKNKTVHISGRYYFYLNFWPIYAVLPGLEIKGLTCPLFVDMQFLFSRRIEMMFEQKKDDQELKSRQKGFSEMIAGMIAAYNYTFLQSSVNVIVAGNSDDSDHTMENCIRGLNYLRNTQFYLERQLGGNSSDKLISKKTLSSIYSLTAKDNPQAVSRLSPTVVIYEEIGKGKKNWSIDTAAFVKPSIHAQNGIKTGYNIYIGCVCAGTKVYTNKGKLINIEDIKQKDGILGYSYNGISKEKITYIQDKVYKQCYEIETRSGTILRCSEDHPLFWSKNFFNYNKREYIDGKRIVTQQHRKAIWKKTKDLKLGDQVGFIEAVPLFGKEIMWEPRLIGMLIGDGTYGIDHSPRMSNCDNEINSYIEERYDSRIMISRNTKDERIYKEIRIKGICQNLRTLGIYGQTKDKKRLPINIDSYNKESLQELIAGLFDTDGCIYLTNTKSQNRISITLSQLSKELLYEVKYVLLKFGINCTIKKASISIRKEERKIKDKDGTWVLCINRLESIMRFKINFNLLIKYKQEKLNQISELGLRSKDAEYWIMVKDYDKHKKTTELQYLNGIRFEDIIRIEDIGEQRVYNLTANTTHTYIANGIITHNTGGEMDEGVADLEARTYNPDEYNILSFKNRNTKLSTEFGDKVGHFVPAWWMKVIDKNGNSLKAESIALLNKEYEESSDKDKYRFKTQTPIYIEDVFLSSDGGYFGQEAIKLLNNRYSLILNHKSLQIERTGILEFVNPKKPWDGIKWTPKKYGWLNIIEEPVLDAQGKKYPNLYEAGCLLPGEKVITNNGLKNVEEVTKKDKLINEDGDLVPIDKFYITPKVNSDIYTIKVSNTFRTNTVTKEHPILISNPKFYLDNTINENIFDFNYIEAKDIKIGDWTRVPNFYNKLNIIFIEVSAIAETFFIKY